MDFLRRVWSATGSVRLPTPVVLVVWGYCGWKFWQAGYIGESLENAGEYVREVKL